MIQTGTEQERTYIRISRAKRRENWRLIITYLLIASASLIGYYQWGYLMMPFGMWTITLTVPAGIVLWLNYSRSNGLREPYRARHVRRNIAEAQRRLEKGEWFSARELMNDVKSKREQLNYPRCLEEQISMIEQSIEKLQTKVFFFSVTSRKARTEDHQRLESIRQLILEAEVFHPETDEVSNIVWRAPRDSSEA